MTEHSEKPVRVFVVEDSLYALEGTRSILRAVPDMLYVGSAVNCAEAIDFIRKEAADVVVLDLKLEEPRPAGSTQPPRKSIEEGFSALEQIAEIAPRLPVVVLTDYAMSENVQRAFLLGALAVLNKGEIAPADLIASIRQALRGYVTLHRVHLASLMAPRSDSLLHLLTPTEYTILEQVAQGKQLGEIAVDTGIAVNTVKTHCRNIRRKLRVRRTYDAAIKVGLVRGPLLEEEDDD